jgi:hypothetical protein
MDVMDENVQVELLRVKSGSGPYSHVGRRFVTYSDRPS